MAETSTMPWDSTRLAPLYMPKGPWLEPSRKAPPLKNTITGTCAPAASTGAKMFTFRQSCDWLRGTSGLWCGWVHPAPQVLTSIV